MTSPERTLIITRFQRYMLFSAEDVNLEVYPFEVTFEIRRIDLSDTGAESTTAARLTAGVANVATVDKTISALVHAAATSFTITNKSITGTSASVRRLTV